jgi:hypothetical protein
LHFVTQPVGTRNIGPPFSTALKESTMKRPVMAAVAIILAAGAATGALVANAQPAPPSSGAQEQVAPGRFRFSMHHHHEHPGWQGREGRGPVAPGTFALVYRQADRELTPPDVQKIAEAFLLWNGNHDWKIVQVGPASGDEIGFAIATSENGPVIARFTMNAHTGRVTRTG